MQTHTAQAVEDTLKVAHQAAEWGFTGLDSVLRGDGFLITVTGMLVVFSGLVVLVLAVKLAFAIIHRVEKKPAPEQQPKTNGVTGEIIAAIGIAMNEFLYEVHDDEKTIVTIQRVSRPYSPWSSKLHNMTRPPLFISKR